MGCLGCKIVLGILFTLFVILIITVIIRMAIGSCIEDVTSRPDEKS